MTEFDKKFNNLKIYIDELEKKFILGFLVPDLTINAEAYELDVRAYCILSHAAFEHYFEEVAEKVMIKSMDNWLSPKKVINDSLLALAAYSEDRLKYDENKSEVFSEHLEAIFRSTKTRLSTRIRMENHGISIEHLGKILMPVGLYIKQDINLRNSLNQLVRQRGLYAHQGRVRNILSPEIAKIYVQDCLLLCDDLRKKANAKFRKRPSKKGN
jgi:hypothetical protein